MPQIADAAFQIFDRVINIAYPETACRRRHELHQTDSTLRRNSPRIVVALRLDDGVHEARIDVVAQRYALHETVKTSSRNNVMSRRRPAAGRRRLFPGNFGSTVGVFYYHQGLAGRV